MNRRVSGVLATAVCLCWLALAGGVGAQPAQAAPSASIDLGGQPLPGGAASTDAPNPTALRPGLWQATLEGTYEQYFTYDRRIQNSRVHIGVLGAPRGTDSDAIKIETSVGEEGAEGYATCGDGDDSTEYSFPQTVIGAAVVVGDEDDDTCRAAATIKITVSRGSASSTADLPYVIKVVEEAPSSSTIGEPDDQPTYTVPDPGTAHDEAGAASFDDAPLLEIGSGVTTVTTTIAEGTEMLWRVPVRWGQQPVVRVDVPPAEGDAAEALPYGGPEVSLHLITPMRERESYTDSSLDIGDSGQYAKAPEGEDGGATLAISGYPVTQADGRVPGDYWISVAVQAPGDRAALDVPVTVTVQLQGRATAGPAYNDAVLSQNSKAGPRGYARSKPFLVAAGTFSAVASGNPAVRGDDDGWLTSRRWAGLGVGVLSALCLGAGAVRLRAARR